MDSFADKYIDQCIAIGLLTKEKIRKFPLRSASIAVILKTYALYNKLPFTINTKKLNIFDDYKLYLTFEGYLWVINEFKKYSLTFLKNTFQFVFSNLEDIKDLENCVGLNNLKGVSGVNYKVGTINSAVLIRQKGLIKKEYVYKTLAEARKDVLNLTRFYPAEQFTLYRTGKTKGVYYKQKVPLILESNRRGMSSILPHLKGKV
jgi:hypothetical protein